MIKREIYSKGLKFLLIAGLALFIHITAYAQKQAANQNLITSDTNSLKKQKQVIFNFFKHIFHKNDKKSSPEYVKKKNSSKKDTVAKKTEPLDLTKGSVVWTSLYTQGVNLNTGISGLYSMGRLSQRVDLYGAPLTVLGTVVFNNGQFERSYSSYSVNFNAEAFEDKLRKRAENILINKRTEGKTPNLSDSMAAYECVRQKIQSPSYQSEENLTKTQFAKDENNLQKNPGSDTTELHSLRQKLIDYERMEKRYDQLFAIKKNYGRLASTDTAGRGEEKLLSNPNSVEKVLLENHQLSPYEKFLMGMKKFSLGQSGEELSEFTLHNFMMNGINMGYEAGNNYTEIGYGKEMAVINPLFMTGINVPEYHRSVEFIRSGEGPEDGSNLYATMIKITDPGSINSLNETNWVFDLTKKVVIGKNVSLEGEIAKSTYSYVPGKSVDSAALPFIPQNNNTFAYAIRGKATIPGINIIIKSEVSQTGGDFITLGNPYLISGATKYEIDFEQSIGKKLNVDIGGTHIIENMQVTNGTKQTDNWIQFSVQYKPTSKINMELKYSPRQFQQESGVVYANSITSNINQISYTANLSNTIWGENATTSVFIGNFQYNTTAVAQMLSESLKLSYYMAYELLMLSPTQGINVSIDESRNDWTGSLSQFIGQSTYNWNVKKSLTVSFGPQWVEQPGIIPNEVGLSGSLSSSIEKWGRIGIQLTYRNSIEKPESSLAQYLISGSVSILW